MEKEGKPRKKPREVTIRINRRFFAVVILIIAVVAAVYVGFGAYTNYVAHTAAQYYQLGYGDGITAAVQNILLQSDNCQTVSVYLGNFTRDMIDVACLQATQ
jgi:hypothetical protein